jgi:hypothetical protein
VNGLLTVFIRRMHGEVSIMASQGQPMPSRLVGTSGQLCSASWS